MLSRAIFFDRMNRFMCDDWRRVQKIIVIVINKSITYLFEALSCPPKVVEDPKKSHPFEKFSFVGMAFNRYDMMNRMTAPLTYFIFRTISKNLCFR